VTLFAVVDAGGAVYSDAPALVLGGKRVAPRPLAEAPRVTLAWERVEPAAANYSNGDASTFHYEPIEYRTTPIAGGDDRSWLRADVRPTLTPDYGAGVGTMRYRLVAHQDGHEVASPRPEARRGGASGGLTDAVTRVSIRQDDSYLGYLTEMFGQPYIWGSAGRSSATHESERLEGSDCADFVIYGARRMGAKLDYAWTGALPAVTKRLGGGTRGTDGVYRDAAGTPVRFTAIGDLVLFPRHVGVLVEDRGTRGVLDDQDVMMHTLFDSPKRQAIADSGYAGTPVEVRRLRALPARR
jgi:cell wall-associated NlpC family hydrolase